MVGQKLICVGNNVVQKLYELTIIKKQKAATSDSVFNLSLPLY